MSHTYTHTCTHTQKLMGTVRNVESFGAFVDVGAERDGFVHVKEISTDFVHAATDVLRSGEPALP